MLGMVQEKIERENTWKINLEKDSIRSKLLYNVRTQTLYTHCCENLSSYK
jgi:hypothetical protein